MYERDDDFAMHFGVHRDLIVAHFQFFVYLPINKGCEILE